MKSTTRLVALCALASALLAGPALADTAKMRIAFSNNYAGNSWRQAMLQAWTEAGKAAIGAKALSAADSFTTADKEVTTQAAQVQNLILQGYDAIVIDAASPDALNGAIKAACDAHIVSGWARGFDPSRAESLGFVAEREFDEIIRIHIEDELGGKLPA